MSYPTGAMFEVLAARRQELQELSRRGPCFDGVAARRDEPASEPARTSRRSVRVNLGALTETLLGRARRRA